MRAGTGEPDADQRARLSEARPATVSDWIARLPSGASKTPKPLYWRARAIYAKGRKEEAIRGYRDLARSRPTQPQAEIALFGAAQLELELGRRAEARRTFTDYLARYPRGRFRSEAQARLSRLDTVE